jgi:hypothetical protein
MNDDAEQKKEVEQKKEAEPPAEPPAPEPERVLLHMPVDVRSAALAVLAVMAVVFTLHWAKAVFVPLMLSLLLTYALAPLVDWLERWKISRWIGAAVILLGLGGGVGWAGYSLSGSASELLDTLPPRSCAGPCAAADAPTPARSTRCRRPLRSSSRRPRRTRPRSRRARAWRGWSSSARPSTCATTSGAARWG